MTKILTDGAGISTVLEDWEFGVLLDALASARKKRFDADQRHAAKLEMIEAQGRIKREARIEKARERLERDEYRAQMIREEREARIEHQRTLEAGRRSEKEEALDARKARAERDAKRLENMAREAAGVKK